VPHGTRPFLFAPACGKLAGETLIGDSQMKRYGALAALLACASLVAACGREDDGSPTSAENESLNNISEVLDASPDSMVAEDPALGNGETGELPVGGEAAEDPAGNGM
jgi:hypothetical protein